MIHGGEGFGGGHGAGPGDARAQGRGHGGLQGFAERAVADDEEVPLWPVGGDIGESGEEEVHAFFGGEAADEEDALAVGVELKALAGGLDGVGRGIFDDRVVGLGGDGEDAGFGYAVFEEVLPAEGSPGENGRALAEEAREEEVLEGAAESARGLGTDVGVCPEEDGDVVAAAVADDVSVSGITVAADNDGGGADFVEFGGDAAAFGAFAEELGEVALADDGGGLAEVVPSDVGGAGKLPVEAAGLAGEEDMEVLE